MKIDSQRWLAGLVFLLFATVSASAQTVTKLCVEVYTPFGVNNCTPVTVTNPLPISASGITVTGVAGSFVDGADVTQGAKGDAAYAGSGAASIIAILKGIYNQAGASIVAGSAIIGKIGIDQTTPGTTNAISVAQVGAAALALGSTTASASIPVVIASNQTAADPCMFQAKTNAGFSSATGTFALVTGVAAKRIFVCSFAVIVPSAVSVSLAEGSSSTCGTSSQAAVIGVATSGTASQGMPLAANGGLTLGNGGGTVASTATAANYLCLFQSGVAQIAGNLTYVQQ